MGNLFERQRKRSGNVEVLVIHNAGENVGVKDEQNSANGQRAKNSDRHIALGQLGLLGGGGDRIESDIREKDESGAGKDTAPAKFAERSGVRRDERLVFFGIYFSPPHGHEKTPNPHPPRQK